MEVLDNVIERFPEVEVTPEEGAGAAVFGIGLAVGALRVVRDERGWLGWILPAGLMFAGLSMMVDSLLDRRAIKIDEAQEVLRSELADLDPLARAQVLKEIAKEQVESLGLD